MLELNAKRILYYLKRKRFILSDSGEAEIDAPPSSLNAETQGYVELIAFAASGAHPPASPSLPIHTGSVVPYPIRGGNTDFERHLCVGRDGFTLHAATRAGGADSAGREALLKYILRPPLAQVRLYTGPRARSACASWATKRHSLGKFAATADARTSRRRIAVFVIRRGSLALPVPG